MTYKVKITLLITIIALAGLLNNNVLPVQAQIHGDTPIISASLPQPASKPIATFASQSATTQDTALTLSPLKAVLIVGPIDGDTGTWTEQEKANMELAAQVLENQGVIVQRFYTPNNDWDTIKAASEGAHFLLYRGHGVYWPSGPDYGGFYLKNTFIRPEQIAEDLHLAPNALVMLYACYAAGTSGSDTGDIGLAEAQYRVARYSEPFLELGAAGYYANWFGNAFESFLTYLFEGQTLGEAYESYFDFNPNTVIRSYHPTYTQDQMWLDKDDWRGYWEYNHAFVGQPDKTLEDLFPPPEPELGNIPESISFVYSTEEGTFMPAAYTIQPQNVTTDEVISWTLLEYSDWYTVSKEAGQTPEPFAITPDLPSIQSANQIQLAPDTSTLTIQATVDGKIETRTIQVELRVVEHLSRLYIPMVTRAFTAQ